MPTYEYRCAKCGRHFDVYQSFSEDPLTKHPECGGKVNKVLCTTMGAATDLLNEGLRRLVVNAVYWGLGMEIPRSADVSFVGDYKPTMYGFDGFKKGMRPADFAMGAAPRAENGT